MMHLSGSSSARNCLGASDPGFAEFVDVSDIALADSCSENVYQSFMMPWRDKIQGCIEG